MSTYGVLQLSIFFLGVDEFLDDVECAGKDEGEKETKAGEVGVALGAFVMKRSSSTGQHHG